MRVLRPLTLALSLTAALGLAGCGGGGPEDPSLRPAELEPIASPVEISELWSHDAGSGSDDTGARLAPAAAGGWLFVADHDGRVQAYDAHSGERNWSVDTEMRLDAGPGAGGELVVVGSKEGQLVALDRYDGSERWRVPVSSEVLAAPVVAPVDAREGADLVVVVQTGDGVVAAYRAGDGTRLWVVDREVPALSLRGTSEPEVSDGRVLVGFANGRLAAVELATGHIDWETAIAVPSGRSELDRLVDIDARPRVWASSVYSVAYNGQVVSLGLGDGNLEWDRAVSSYAGLGVDFRYVYVTDDQSRVWALDRFNGASMWQQDGLHHRGLTAPVPYGDYVAVGDREGYLHLLSRYDGAILGRVKVDGDGLATAPVVVDDQLCAYGRGGTLACYQAGDAG